MTLIIDRQILSVLGNERKLAEKLTAETQIRFKGCALEVTGMGEYEGVGYKPYFVKLQNGQKAKVIQASRSGVNLFHFDGAKGILVPRHPNNVAISEDSKAAYLKFTVGKKTTFHKMPLKKFRQIYTAET